MALSEAVRILVFLHKYFIMRISPEASYQVCGVYICIKTIELYEALVVSVYHSQYHTLAYCSLQVSAHDANHASVSSVKYLQQIHHLNDANCPRHHVMKEWFSCKTKFVEFLFLFISFELSLSEINNRF